MPKSWAPHSTSAGCKHCLSTSVLQLQLFNPQLNMKEVFFIMNICKQDAVYLTFVTEDPKFPHFAIGIFIFVPLFSIFLCWRTRNCGSWCTDSSENITVHLIIINSNSNSCVQYCPPPGFQDRWAICTKILPSRRCFCISIRAVSLKILIKCNNVLVKY